MRHLKVLGRVSAALTASDDLDAILDAIVGGLVVGAEAALARIWLYGGSGECPVCAARGRPPATARDTPALHLRASAGIHTNVDGAHHRVALGALKMGEIARTRTPIWTNDVGADPRVPDKAWVAHHGLRAFAGYPLVFRGELVGTLGAFFRRAVTPTELDQLNLLAGQAATAIKNAHLFRQVARFHERELEARFAATLAERVRLAREIHDTLLQGFTGLTLQLQSVARRLARDRDPDLARESLERMLALADGVLVDARRAVWDMRAPELESGTLASALEEVARRAADGAAPGAAPEIRVRVSGRPSPLPATAELAVFRIGQEAVTNAVKHAGARTVDVELAYRRRSVRLVVRDDGCGFDPAEMLTARGGHWGLLGMRERANQAGGRLAITSAPGRGTEVTLHVRRAASPNNPTR